MLRDLQIVCWSTDDKSFRRIVETKKKKIEFNWCSINSRALRALRKNSQKFSYHQSKIDFVVEANT